MEIIEVGNFISQTGFPVFVAVFVLFRLEKVIKENTKSINTMLNYCKKL